MSDTTGWQPCPTQGAVFKVCDVYRFEIHEQAQCFILLFADRLITHRPTLRECQKLAHATARLWAGEKE